MRLRLGVRSLTEESEIFLTLFMATASLAIKTFSENQTVLKLEAEAEGLTSHNAFHATFCDFFNSSSASSCDFENSVFTRGLCL